MNLLRLAFLLTMLSLACGRTGAATRPHSDASQDQTEDSAQEQEDSAQEQSEDRCCTGDVVGGDLDGSWICGVKIAGTREVPIVEILVDTSESMGDPVPGTGQSRWELSRDVLKQVISSLTSASPAVGLTFFPNTDDCSLAPASVPAAPITEQTRAQLITALDNVAGPAGTRSTAAALALAQADATDKAFPNGLVLGPAILVLLTAGAPDPSPQCGLPGDPVLGLENQVRAAYAAGDVTCVFALPGAGAARELLIDVAKLGAGASDSLDAAPTSYCFQDCDQAANSASLLATGIKCVLDFGVPSGSECYNPYPQEGSAFCFIALNLPDEIDPDTAQVSVTTGASSPRIVPRVDCSSGAGDGWDFVPGSVGPNALIFCGQSCSDFMASWSYTITFGCRGG